MAQDEKVVAFDNAVEQPTDEEVAMLVEENHRRNYQIFGDYDPLTGKNCYDFENRVHVRIYDFSIPEMWVPKECLDNEMFKGIADLQSIKLYIQSLREHDHVKVTFTEELKQECTMLLARIRCKYDPEFALFLTDKIQDKVSGEMVPFRLNYPQRILLKELEDSRRKGKGTYIVLLKARQWGGSTLVQLYMKWIQDYLHDGWNSIIIAQRKDTAKKIKAMYKKAIQHQDGWTVGKPGERLMMSPYENSVNDFVVSDSDGPIRRSVISISAFEVVDNARGENYHMAHMSEVAYWKQTQEHDPEAVIASILGGIRNQKDNVVVFESTGQGASGFFYNIWQEARNPDYPSLFKPVFIPFYIIENDRMELEESEQDFARWLLEHRNYTRNPRGFRETGTFFWRLWKLGASFEAINWYRINRNAHADHSTMATEAPVDEVEAFKTSGNLVFNPYSIAEMRDENVKQPAYYANINIKGGKGKKVITDSTIKLWPYGDHGEVKIWNLPNNNILNIKNRYVVSVDIGGSGSNSDYTVMTVLDRMGLCPGVNGKLEVVARFRGHCRHDVLAWKAAVLAHYYDDAMLVIESNTADRERDNNTEGDHFGTIIEEIADYYDNLYTRANAPENTKDNFQQKFGFQTNKLTKGWLIDNLTAFIEDKLWVEPDDEMYHELSIYERRQDGSMGNIKGRNNHDDVLMSTAIALWVAVNDMDKPDWKRITKSMRESRKTQLNEATL